MSKIQHLITVKVFIFVNMGLYTYYVISAAEGEGVFKCLWLITGGGVVWLLIRLRNQTFSFLPSRTIPIRQSLFKFHSDFGCRTGNGQISKFVPVSNCI